jgi:two-component system cell cycle sensor histidine kinase/response regulator CckA
MDQRHSKNGRWAALRIVGIYVAFADLWIYFSDHALSIVAPDAGSMVRVSVLKGFLFIVVTAALLYQLIARYIRASRERESALRRSDERYRLLFNSINDAVFVHGLTTDGLPGRIVEVNDIACERLGYSREELVRMGPLDIDAPEGAALVPQMMRRLQAEKHALWEGTHMTKSGHRVPVEISDHLVELEGERVILSTVRDITARRRLEETLARERALLQTLIDNLPDHVSVKDCESRILIANTANARVMGCERAEEVIGKTDRDFYDPAEAERFVADEKRVTVTGEALVNKEEEITDRQGRRRWMLTTKVPLRDAEGSIVGVVCAGRDITGMRASEEALRRSEEKLVQAQKMEAIGRLAGGIAHDFNNLLTVISGYASVIDQSMPPGHDMKSEVHEIKRAALRAAELTAQLLTFSRRQAVQPRVIGLRGVVAGMQNMLNRLIGEDVALSLRLDPETGNVRADPGQIGQVVMNLAVNARDAMPAGGNLIIETGNISIGEDCAGEHPGVTPGEYVMLVVSDTGVGMDQETQSRLFEPFFTTKETGKGTGLGLATVYGIVRQGEGFITCTSARGAGATFSIFLPRLFEHSAGDAAALPSSAAVTGTGTILLVEDEEALRAFSRSILVKSGYTVIEAADGEEALREMAAARCVVHLLLTDVVMPHMGGPELVRKARAMCPGLKVIYMSGYAESSLRQPSVSGSEADIRLIQKPFDAADLLGAIRDALGAEGTPVGPGLPHP